MADENRIGGVAYVRAGSTSLPIGGTITVSIDEVEREGKAGLSGPVGYTETPRIPSIEIEVLTRGDLDLEAVKGITKATVQAELANGRIAVLTDAWQAGAIEVAAADGTATIRFEGLDGQWV